MSDFVKLYLMTLHELYIDVKQQVAAAVAAVNQATIAAAVYTEQTITDALAAVHALDDYLDYFGLVGSPMDAAVNLLIDQLLNLAMALDNQGYYAIYQQTFGATNQYQSAKSSYSGFVGGLGGTSSGGGANGIWGEADPLKAFPVFQCFNTQAATLHTLPAADPPPESAIDFTVLLGPCSDVFIYPNDNPNGFWQAGIYQYMRLQAWVRLIDQDTIFEYDWGDTPDYPTFTLWNSYESVITDRTDEFYMDYSFNDTDWSNESFIPTWPYDSSERVLNGDGEGIRDPQWDILGRHEQWGNSYWLYHRRYWEVRSSAHQMMFLNPCSETPDPGKDLKPIPSPLLPILINDNLRKQLTQRLGLGAIWLPYEVCFDRQKLLWEGEQITFGDV